jgi:glutamine amidotransferase
VSTIAVIDYGMGNLRSVSKALEHVSPNSKIIVTDNADAIRSADKIVFPGVGAMRDCMNELEKHNLSSLVKEIATDRPFLGICLGMQLLLDSSEENGGTAGLGILQGEVKQFPKPAPNSGIKIPHMGWNEVNQISTHPLWHNIPDKSRFYFVHSYYASPTNLTEVAARTNYSLDFSCALQHNSIFATQFHPEKSQLVGLQLLKNFTEWNGQA